MYTGLLGSVGLGFLVESRYLLPLTASLLAVAVAALAYRARSRRGYGPLGLGLVASGLLLAGKFALDSGFLLYLGLGLLVAASVWNVGPRRAAGAGSRGAFAAKGPEVEPGPKTGG